MIRCFVDKYSLLCASDEGSIKYAIGKKMKEIIKEDDEHNRGMKIGYDGALRAVRAIDRQIEYPTSDLDDDVQYKIIYNAQKDLLYKIYQAIKEEKDEYTDD